MGEQPNPWDLLQPQDVTSRHRGAKPPRRYELLGEISLLSPAYLLSFERWPFHAEPPDHYALLSYLIDLTGQVSGPILHLTILQSPVFLINSRLDLFTAASIAAGDPSPEVTGLFCLIP
eukprot:g33003.t1